MSSLLYPNNHSLYRLTRRDTEPCWRIAYLEELTGRLTNEQKASYDNVTNGDFPHGLIHDETCRTCRGTGLQPVEIVIGYDCIGCGLRGEHELFTSTSCLNIGAGLYEELRANHEAGEHDSAFHQCPLCVAAKYVSA